MSRQRTVELTSKFEDTYSKMTLEELIHDLTMNMKKIIAIIDTMSDREMFEPHMRRWAEESTRDGNWPVVRLIHINTVAPFRSFRTKIRKWKKAEPVPALLPQS